MYFVAPAGARTSGTFAVLKPSPSGSADAPLCIGVFDSKEDAEDLAETLNDRLGIEEELEDLPPDLTDALRTLCG